jgi:hypothetical protein
MRHQEILLTRERSVLRELELEISQQLSHAVRDIDHNYRLAGTNLNRRSATEDEVDAIQVLYDVGTTRIDVLLQSQQRRAEAESAYYRSLVDYNLAVMNVHYRKGSLLEYNGVYLAEGPWPNKAYFDALNRARRRDASIYMNYGFTRPDVISRGPHDQFESIPPGQFVEPLPLGTGTSEAGERNANPGDSNPNGGEFIPMPAEFGNGDVVPQSATMPFASATTLVEQPTALQPLPMHTHSQFSGYIETVPLAGAARPIADSNAATALPQMQPTLHPVARPAALPKPSAPPANPFRDSTAGEAELGQSTLTTIQ